MAVVIRPPRKLTDTEIEFLRLLADGLPAKTAALMVGRTAPYNLTDTIRHRMRAKTLTQAVAEAIRQGWIS